MGDLNLKHVEQPSFFGMREPVNAVTHLAGAAIMIPLSVFTLFGMPDGSVWPAYVSVIIYVLSVFCMFLSSGLYHALPLSGPRVLALRRIDHIMIYFVIAGSYTPFCVLVLEGWFAWAMLVGIWAIALLGIIKKVVWFQAPKWLSLTLYLLMGWLAVFSLPGMHAMLPFNAMMWVYIGGLSYTAGAVIYGRQKPNPYPGYLGFHELWHLFVLGGAFSHYYVVHRFVSQLPY